MAAMAMGRWQSTCTVDRTPILPTKTPQLLFFCHFCVSLSFKASIRVFPGPPRLLDREGEGGGRPRSCSHCRSRSQLDEPSRPSASGCPAKSGDISELGSERWTLRGRPSLTSGTAVGTGCEVGTGFGAGTTGATPSSLSESEKVGDE